MFNVILSVRFPLLETLLSVKFSKIISISLIIRCLTFLNNKIVVQN